MFATPIFARFASRASESMSPFVASIASERVTPRLRVFCSEALGRRSQLDFARKLPQSDLLGEQTKTAEVRFVS